MPATTPGYAPTGANRNHRRCAKYLRNRAPPSHGACRPGSDGLGPTRQHAARVRFWRNLEPCSEASFGLHLVPCRLNISSGGIHEEGVEGEQAGESDM